VLAVPALGRVDGDVAAAVAGDAGDLLLSGYATRLLGHALTRRSVTCHRVPLKMRGTLLHDQ
jgi:hypothetical protein